MRGGWTKTLSYIVTRLGLGLAVWCPPKRSPASASRYVTRRKYGTEHVKLAKVTVPALHGSMASREMVCEELDVGEGGLNPPRHVTRSRWAFSARKS